MFTAPGDSEMSCAVVLSTGENEAGYCLSKSFLPQPGGVVWQNLLLASAKCSSSANDPKAWLGKHSFLQSQLRVGIVEGRSAESRALLSNCSPGERLG